MGIACQAQITGEEEEDEAPSPPASPSPPAPTGSMGATPGAPPPPGPAGAQPPPPATPAPQPARDIRFQPGRGFYDAPVRVAITTSVAGASIRYTTDGTMPTATTGMPYAGPIEVRATSVIRAGAFKDGMPASYADTHTYLFLDDVIRQSPETAMAAGWPASWGINVVDYGMDQRVVNDPRYAGTIKNDLKSIPTLSLVMKLADLFDPTVGIYANARNDGLKWERPGSLELIHPDGKAGYQINAGVRIRGGFSRDKANPKHAFRLFFRKDYGPEGKLKFPMFGAGGAPELDKFDLRCAQNYSWSFQGDGRGVFLRDQFARDSQLEMGHQAERGDFYHLYINGQYWGLYNSGERPSGDFAASYFGDTPDDWDVVKVDAGKGYIIYATDGDMMSWTRLYNAARLGPLDDPFFLRVQGLKPDGSRDAALENLVDVDNLIDYMLLIYYTGNFDAPVSRFLGEMNPNNYYGMRSRKGTSGFRFLVHDSEHTLLDVNENRTGPFPAGDQGITKSNPQWLFQKLGMSPEFRLRIADRIQKHFFGDGALTPAKAAARFMRRKTEIDRAVVAESARWGDSKRMPTQRPLTRDDHWINEINRIVSAYFPMRTNVVLGQLRAKGWYPTVPAPVLSQPGGDVVRGFRLAMMGAEGMVLYTLDGTDPRALGGQPSPAARTYAAPVTLNADTVIKSRTRAPDGTWSALSEAAFKVK